MLLGARNIMMSGGWKNPYVTDGLVAMWDGEWNAGGGKHISSTMRWVDVCGNEQDMTPYDGITPLVFNDKALITTDTVPYNTTSGRLINDKVSSYTIECGFLNLRCGYSRNAFYNGSLNSTTGTTFNGMIWGSGIGTNTPMRVCINNVAYQMNSTISTGERVYLAIAFNNGSGDIYHNGIIDIQTTTSGINGNTNLFIGAGGSAAMQSCYSEYYFLRIYSRSLLVDEISHNYQIDKKRFNLP